MSDNKGLIRFVNSCVRIGFDGVSCTKIEIFHRQNRLDRISIGGYDGEGPKTAEDIVSKLHEIADDITAGATPGTTVQFQVKAYFGTNPDPGRVTQFSKFRPLDDEDSGEGYGDSPTPQGMIAHALRHSEVNARQYMQGTAQLQNKLLAQIDNLSDTVSSKDKTIETLQNQIQKLLDAAIAVKIKEQELIDREEDRKRQREKDAHDAEITKEFMEGGMIALGALLPLLASNGSDSEPKALPPGVNAAVMHSLKKFVSNLKDEQVKAMAPYLSQEAHQFVFKCALFNQGMGPAPELEEVNAFFDWMLDNPDNSDKIRQHLNMPQQMFMTSHLAYRAKVRPQLEAAE